MSSTLVETVSINYDDFNDSFLTCGTCLCPFDGAEHCPKLLPCSHTVCRNCLERIVQVSRDRSQIRCPICRGSLPMPTGGIGSLPPSFLVNQLLDLMAHQRRDIVPKCSSHTSQELLFCESCDAIFCLECASDSHSGGRGASSHTVIPFSIALKRMSEILFYKANLCLKNLDRASEVVSQEIQMVGQSAEDCINSLNAVFGELLQAVEDRRKEMEKVVLRVRDEKRLVLHEQLSLITSEKDKVQAECRNMQQQLEVRSISKKITDFNEHLDTSTTLIEPRENVFMTFQYEHNSAKKDLHTALRHFGRVRVSKTFPALCTVRLFPVVVHLESCAVVTTLDYHGNPRTSGNDPVVVSIHEDETDVPVRVELRDDENGQYTAHFTVTSPGNYTLFISIFGRPIKDIPRRFTVTDHNNPVRVGGGKGSGPGQFVQPVTALIHNDLVYVLDTGNSRVQVLDAELHYQRSISGATGLEGRSCTGLAVTGSGDLVLTNWRSLQVTVVSLTGELVSKFTSDAFVEPTAVAANSHGEIIVADNGLKQLLVFNTQGDQLFVISGTCGSHGRNEEKFHQITSVQVGSNNEILVTDYAIHVFSRAGQFLRLLLSPTRAYGVFGGVTVDADGNFLATRQEKGRSVILVMDPEGRLKFIIDSFDDKLKRPSGLVTTRDGHVIVADLGNDQVKKYRYK